MSDVASLEAKRARLSAAKRALLARRIRKGRSAPAGAPGAIPRRREEGPAPLSFAQQRLWFLDQLVPGSSAYNCFTALRLNGPLDASALRVSLTEIVRRHQALRSVFGTADGEPVQQVLPAVPVALPSIDLGGLEAAARDREAHRLALAEAGRPFDLEAGPLLRSRLLVLGRHRQVLALTVHHIAWDGWSTTLFARELIELYRSRLERRAPRLPELELQYADYAAWQRQWMSGEVLARQLAYWRAQLADSPGALALHPDRPRDALASPRGGAVTVELGAELSAGLRALAAASGATLFMVLLAAYQALLGRLSGQGEVLVGTSIAGRNRVEVEGLIGFFVNTLVLRGDLSGDPSWKTFLGRVRETALGAFAHEDLPFEKLVEELAPERSLQRTPIFQAAFSFQGAAPPPPEVLPGLTLAPFDAGGLSAKFEITLDVVDLGTHLSAALEYDAALYDRTTASRIARRLTTLLQEVAEAADPSLSRLALLSAGERHQLVLEWGRVRSEIGPAIDLTALAGAGGRVCCASEELGPKELAGRSYRLARLLRSRGVGPEVAVGLCVERSVDLVVGYLGILAAGGTCVPLDGALPAARLAWMLDETGVALLLTSGDLFTRLPPAARAIESLRLDGDAALLERESPEPPAPASFPETSLAYVIFTSGSTGQPKAVGVSRGALARHLGIVVEAYGLSSRDRVLQFAAASFDVSVEQLLAPLVAGASLRVRGEETWSPRELDRRIRDGGLTFVNLPTGYWQQWLEELELGAHWPRLMIAGGDTMPPASVRRWLQLPEAGVLSNGYGPTEGVITATLWNVPRRDPGSTVPIGRPLPGRRVAILGAGGSLVPAGVVGELCLGGAVLARGYLGRPGLTAERFVPDPFSGIPGGRLYRTGDLARWRHDGALEHLGRDDHQVKVRGFRIELGEIEERLSRVAGVAASVVTVREDLPGDRRLVAYAVPDPGHELGWEEVRGELARALPGYMLPSALVVLDALPLTSHGKVDRGALPAPEAESDEATYAAPRTAVEELMAEIWAEVLNLRRVGVDGNFFALGGHSLLATRVVSRLRPAFGVELPLRDLFEAPTVAGLAARVESALRAGLPGGEIAAPPIEPVARTGPLPLSFAQQRLWFLDQLEPGSPAYNMPVALKVEGPLEIRLLARSLEEVVRRHEVLRTTFPSADSEPVQRIGPAAPVGLPVVDFGRLSPEIAGGLEGKLAGAEAARPFSLDAGPLLRAMVLRRSRREHAVLVTMHHIVSDGWSMGLLVREIAKLYVGFREGSPSSLPELPVQYSDFARWQRAWLRGETLERQVSWWRDRLEGLPPVLELPADRPRPRMESSRGAMRRLPLAPELAETVETFGRRQGATPFMVTLAGLLALLSRSSGQRDLAVGSPVSGRHRLEIEGLVGFFVNTLVLRADLRADPTFGELVTQVRETVLAAHTHQDVPFEKLVEELAPERSLTHSPLFQVMFSLDHVSRDDLAVADLRLASFGSDGGAAKFDLSVAVENWGGEPAVAAEYRVELFDATTVERLLQQFLRLLENGLAENRPVSALAVLGESGRHQLLREWGRGGTSPPPAADLPALTRPGAAMALRCGGEQLSRGELSERCHRLARHLRARGVGPEVAVGLLVERSVEMVVGLLAILEAGGTCVPLDPALPAERLERMLDETGAALLLSRESLLAGLPTALAGVPHFCFDSDGALVDEQAPEPLGESFAQDSLAYVIFTSGSTGVPKGVGVSRGALARHLGVMKAVFGLEAEDRVLQFASLSFDVAFEQLLTPLAAGAAVVVRGEEAWSPRDLDRQIREHGLTVADLPAGFWHQWVQDGDAGGAESGSSLRLMSVGGDTMPPASVRGWARKRGAERLLNAYGPTEGVITASVFEVPRQDPGFGVSIGRPLPGRRLAIHDPAGRAVPAGVVGELCLADPWLARGYLGRPGLTAERFVPDPLAEAPGGRLYRTGDLARWRPDGCVEHLGRDDHQVKIRGFRIELGEIEDRLRRVAGVAGGVVVAREDVPGDRRLAAYAVPEPGVELAWSEVREELVRALPGYMLPAAFVVLESLPLTPNGKVDREALPAPEGGGEAGAYVAPRSAAEELLAGIWEEVLGVERVSAEASFFALGGHSLLATRVISRLRPVFGVELPLRDLFEAPTVAGLAARVESAARSGGALAPPIEPVSRAEPLQLSFAQQRLWFIDQMEPGSPVYNLPVALKVEGALEIAVLARSLEEVLRRHEVLRTVFASVNGEPVQVIRPAGAVALPVVDLGGLAAEAAEAVERALVREEASRSFRLDAGPLFRALVLRRSARVHAVLVTMHHIASDGWSMDLLIRELSELYAVFREGGASPLPELAVQYADFARWQRAWLTGEVLAGEVDWWRDRLAGLPAVLELPADRPRPRVASSRGAVCRVPLAPEIAGAVEDLGKRRGATPFMVTLAGLMALLGRSSGQRDLAVGTPVAGRHRLELENLMGFFVNTLVLRGDLGGDPSMAELVGRVRETVLAAHLHQDVPFEKLVEELAVERSLAHSPFFQVAFSLERVGKQDLEIADLRVASFGAGGGTAKFDLSVAVEDWGGEAAIGAEYRTDLFDATTIERFLGRYLSVLRALAADSDRRLCELPVWTAPELHQLLWEWNDTAAAVPAGFAHAGIVERAGERPDAVALASLAGSVSYGELADASARLAGHLVALGVGPERIVAVCLERSPDLVMALLAVWMAGGCYLPLDPDLPESRLEDLCRDSAAVALVARGGMLERLRHEKLVEVDVDRRERWHGAERLPAARLLLDHPAYVIYTSGSTGRPKGVVISHRSLLNLLDWHQRIFRIEAADRVPQLAGLGFDAVVWELWPNLMVGAGIAFPAEETRRDPEAVRDWLVAERIPRAFLPTPLAEAVLGLDWPEELALRALSTGGDRLRRRPSNELPFRLVNLYGPTEASVISTYATVSAGGSRAPSIGRPIVNARLYVLDLRFSPVPAGSRGELCIAGAGLARGYLGRPARTAEAFVPDPWSAVSGGRLYRTGDTVRHLPDGKLDFFGRTDHQVKIRGFRIELGEIEAALTGHAGVREAVVLAREDLPGQRRLVAYTVGETSVGELRRHLAERLPDYMLPAAFVELDALPLTANGKVDRRALPTPEGGAPESYVAPRTAVEELLAGIWAEVLGVRRVGARESFFDLGGHSLLATRVISRLRPTFGVELPLRDLFEAPTVAGLAARVESARRTGRDLAPAIESFPRTADSPLPLSFAQQRLWFVDRMEPGSPAYNVPVALKVEGRLEIPVLARSLEEVVRRHQVLRTVFAEVDGEPVQVIHPPAPFSLPEVDLGGLPGAAAEAVARELAATEAGRPFRLDAGPLFRALVVRLGGEHQAVFLTVHHVASDGWSMGLLVGEISALYVAFRQGRPSPLPELPVQYADFARWQRAWLTGDVLAREVEWWRDRLEGMPPVLELPADRPRPRVESSRGGERRLALASEVAAGIETLGRRLGATPFMVTLAGLLALLGRASGQRDLAVGTPVAGRHRLEIENLVGFFVNTLVLRGDLAGDPSVHELVVRVRETVLAAHNHQDVPFEKLVEELAPARSLAHSPLFQVTFAVDHFATENLAIADLRVASFGSEERTAKFDLSVALEGWGGDAALVAGYRADLFDGTTVERLLRRFDVLLRGMAGDAARRLSELPAWTGSELHQLLFEWNDTRDAGADAADLPHRQVLARAAEAPDAVALTFPGGSWSYGELADRGRRLAGHLGALGVGPGDAVAVCLERSPEMVMAVLAVLIAGGCYVPLDPELPAKRLEELRRDSAAVALVSRGALLERFGHGGLAIVDLDRAGTWNSAPVAPRQPRLEPQHPAYVIYTSGSTGHPKGVTVSHGALRNLVGWHRNSYGIEPGDRATQLAGLGFDAVVWELWPYLTAGAAIALSAGEVRVDPAAARDWLVAERITWSFLPTPLAEAALGLDWPAEAALSALLTGGDRLRRGPGAAAPFRLVNHYGPTESCVVTTSGAVAAGDPRDVPPIGRPISNLRTYVLDRRLTPVPAGSRGELCIAGGGLARGYLRRPARTARSFVPDAWSGEPGGRLYRTGDLVRHLPEGRLDFLGRADHQVKVRGFRIELGEIEAALASHAEVREAVVLVREDAHGQRRLVAYTVGAASARDLRSHLGERLPEYMVPAAFVALKSLPLNPNGKVDRRALPAPAAGAAASAYVAPRDLLELDLVRIFEELLETGPVGVRESFFELGGHSLLAVRLTSRIEAAQGRRLPLTLLFEEPTVEALARALRRGPAGRAPALVRLRAGVGAQRPLTFIHPVGGDVLCYRDLARHLDPNRPFFALRARGIEGDREPLERVEEMAAIYLEHLRREQPEGPYLLGGWSIGGMIAWEMARRLEDAGEPVALVALLDTSALPPGEPADELQLLADFAQDLGLPPADLRSLAEDVADLSPEELFEVLLTRGLEAGLVPPDLGADRIRSLWRVYRANATANRRYRPRPGPAPVRLWRARESLSRTSDPSFGWDVLARGGLATFDVRGDHDTILKEPQVRTVARQLRRCLKEIEVRT